MRIIIGLLALVLSFGFVEAKAEGRVSIGGFSVDGRFIEEGINLPPGIYGQFHQKTEIDNLNGIESPERIAEQGDSGKEELDIEIPSVYISTPKEISESGFASTTAKRLLEENRQSE